MAIKSNLFEYWKQKEIEWGRNISVSEVAKATKKSRDTIHRARTGQTTLPDQDTLAGLCKFFGVEAGPVPFIIYEPD